MSTNEQMKDVADTLNESISDAASILESGVTPDEMLAVVHASDFVAFLLSNRYVVLRDGQEQALLKSEILDPLMQQYVVFMRCVAALHAKASCDAVKEAQISERIGAGIEEIEDARTYTDRVLRELQDTENKTVL